MHAIRTVLYALLSVTQHQNFSNYSLLLDATVLVSKLKKNSAKYHQIDFLGFTSKLEVCSSSEIFVITKWTNQVLFCLG